MKFSKLSPAELFIGLIGIAAVAVVGISAVTTVFFPEYRLDQQAATIAPPAPNPGPDIQRHFDSLEAIQTSAKVVCSPMLAALQAGSAERMYLAAKDAEEACFNYASKARTLEIPASITGAAREDCELATKHTDKMLQCRAMMCSAIQKMVDAKGVGERAEASRALEAYGADVIQLEKDFTSIRSRYPTPKKN